jgi:hypothetical protein
MGVGGSVFQWHPELKLGFSYVPTSLIAFDFVNLRAAVLQEVVTDCLKKQQQQ